MNKLLFCGLAAALLLIACASQKAMSGPVPTEPVQAGVAAAPQRSPSPIGTTAAARGPSARFAELLAAARSGTLVEKFPEKEPSGAAIAAEHLPAGISNAEVFSGTFRASAKTSFAAGPAQLFASTAALLQGLPTDAEMQAKFAHLVTDGVDAPREDVENKNVAIEGAWIYWAKKESDHDFHVIVGDTPFPDEGTILLNTEVAGLPPENPTEPDITATRATIKRLIAQRHPEQGLFDPPIHVRITGSLFWDGEHANQHVGPAGLQPDTAWEIHPLKQLSILPD